MIERAASGAALSVMAAATAASKPAPEVWHLLGYPFEAAGMIAALFGCFCARWWSVEQLRMRKTLRWTLDVPISALTFAVTMGAIITTRPEPLLALGTGAGIGVVGEGLFKLAQRYVEKLGLFGEAPAPISVLPHPLPRDIEKLTHDIDEEPKA